MSRFTEAFNSSIVTYIDADLSLLGVNPDNPGEMPKETPTKFNGGAMLTNPTQRTVKGIATRKALYGETKLKPSTVKSMESRGDHVRHVSSEKRGKTGRAN